MATAAVFGKAENVRALSWEAAAMLALDGRLFLHQQGRTLCRGRVAGLRLSDGYWDLLVAEIDYFDREERCWERRVAEDA